METNFREFLIGQSRTDRPHMKNIISVIKGVVPKKYHLLIFDVYTKIIIIFYKGHNYVCPICNINLRKFLPSIFINGSNPNEFICPKCKSLNRQRLLYLYLKYKTVFFSRQIKLLHMAPEPCLYGAFKSMKNIDYVSSDLSSPAMIKVDITDMPYKNNSFDVILCSHVLEHIVEDQKAIGELFRILKMGGWAIIQSPIDFKRQKTFEDSTILSPSEREKNFGLPDHVRIYGLDYKDRLEKSGFVVNVDGCVKHLNGDLVKKFGLDKNESIYLCTKNKVLACRDSPHFS